MRWRQAFIAELSSALQRLGLRAYPLCSSADVLGIGRFPRSGSTAGLPPGATISPREDHDYHLTFALRIECTTRGHLMLFNAEKYRTGKEPILNREPAEEEGQHRQ